MDISMVLVILAAYLFGSVSSAIVLTRIFMKQDIRNQGSGNPGTTNVLRVAGKKAAAMVFVFDLLKGAIPVYTGFLLGFEPIALSLIAISACVGHIFPLYYQFKGGKGVATAIGAIAPLHPLLTLGILLTWLTVFALFRISSLAAIATFSLAPFYTYAFKPEYTLAVSLLCVLILLKHKDNFSRLLSKEEGKIGRSKD